MELIKYSQFLHSTMYGEVDISASVRIDLYRIIKYELDKFILNHRKIVIR